MGIWRIEWGYQWEIGILRIEISDIKGNVLNLSQSSMRIWGEYTVRSISIGI